MSPLPRSMPTLLRLATATLMLASASSALAQGAASAATSAGGQPTQYDVNSQPDAPSGAWSLDRQFAVSFSLGGSTGVYEISHEYDDNTTLGLLHPMAEMELFLGVPVARTRNFVGEHLVGYLGVLMLDRGGPVHHHQLAYRFDSRSLALTISGGAALSHYWKGMTLGAGLIGYFRHGRFFFQGSYQGDVPLTSDVSVVQHMVSLGLGVANR